jgi:hypothetical protein
LSADTLKLLFQEYTSAGKVLQSRSEKETAGKVCEVLKAHLRDIFFAKLHEAADQPLLLSYSSDATSVVCRCQDSVDLKGKTVTRCGKELYELLMQQMFCKTVSSTGAEQAAILYFDPIPLSAGKTSWHLFEAACQSHPHPRKSGHKAILLYHFCSDRAVLSSLGRMLAQRLEAFFRVDNCMDEDGGLLRLLTWYVQTGCAGHDCHNGMKWSVMSYLDADGVRDVHIVIESLRNSFSSAHGEINKFLCGRGALLS